MFDVNELKIRRNTWIRSSGLPQYLIGREFSDCTEIPKEIMETVSNWMFKVQKGEIINALGHRTCGKGIAFYGGPGQGKTTLAAAIIQEAMRTFSLDVFELNAVRPCYFITYASLIDLKGETMDDSVDEAKRNLYLGIMGDHPDEIRNVKILVLDDVGNEHVSGSGWNKSMLHHLLRSRFNKGLPTIVTSNILVEGWIDKYGAATGSFAHEAFWNMILNSEEGDLRK
jgi:DNA replication protein DnaC